MTGNLSMRQRLMYVLAQLERQLPPPAGMHHSIGLATQGAELALHIAMKDGGVKTLYLDDEDFTKLADDFIAAVVGMVRK